MPNLVEPSSIRVWDLPLRITHWLLVLCVAGSWSTHYAGAAWFTWHARCGYTALVLVVFRILWGFVGTRHARFASFVRGPRAVARFIRGQGDDRAVGHNPLGALSVLAMLASLLFQAATGLFANDEIAASGPFYGWISPVTSHRITSWHHANSDVLLVLLALHAVAVLWHAFVRKRPIVKAMITGRRRVSQAYPDDATDLSRGWLAAVIVVVLAGLLALAIRAAPEATISPY
jgi:cytochrome b